MSRIVAEIRERLEADTMKVRSRTVSAYESVPDALLVVGRDGSIEFANLHAARLFGYEPGQLVGVERSHSENF